MSGAAGLQRPVLVLTMPAGQQARWRAALEAQGVVCASLPLLEIQPLPEAVGPAWAALTEAALAIFVSPSAVAALDGSDWAQWPAQTVAACVGPGTALALSQRGVPQVLCPPPDSAQFDSEALWPLIQELGPWVGRTVLIFKGEGGRDWLAERLLQEGAKLQAFNLYLRVPPSHSEEQLATLGVAPLWLLTSSQGLDVALACGWIRSGAQALATHPRIAEHARRAGLRVELVRSEPEAVAQAWARMAAA
ncbi:uroporphyrinogen-III synthase [Inhella inkyongensis]|uniref:Uroporphyrinogen-III synthase n=1 Tax=Inhella inkyongensis TaxID=392593 RepID=A0A840S8S6_9BURK|nr:uroporphyrinogen-III synthase [Inhella inkyongensis]MBB5206022.1 uroporphyrinogen-III synthase [Inhella inkyongensis]